MCQKHTVKLVNIFEAFRVEPLLVLCRIQNKIKNLTIGHRRLR